MVVDDIAELEPEEDSYQIVQYEVEEHEEHVAANAQDRIAAFEQVEVFGDGDTAELEHREDSNNRNIGQKVAWEENSDQTRFHFEENIGQTRLDPEENIGQTADFDDDSGQIELVVDDFVFVFEMGIVGRGDWNDAS